MRFIKNIESKVYHNYESIFKSMLKIIEKWIDYYLEDGNLLRISEQEINEIKRLDN